MISGKPRYLYYELVCCYLGRSSIPKSALTTLSNVQLRVHVGGLLTGSLG